MWPNDGRTSDNGLCNICFERDYLENSYSNSSLSSSQIYLCSKYLPFLNPLETFLDEDP